MAGSFPILSWRYCLVILFVFYSNYTEANIEVKGNCNIVAGESVYAWKVTINCLDLQDELVRKDVEGLIRVELEKLDIPKLYDELLEIRIRVSNIELQYELLKSRVDSLELRIVRGETVVEVIKSQSLHLEQQFKKIRNSQDNSRLIAEELHRKLEDLKQSQESIHKNVTVNIDQIVEKVITSAENDNRETEAIVNSMRETRLLWESYLQGLTSVEKSVNMMFRYDPNILETPPGLSFTLWRPHLGVDYIESAGDGEKLKPMLMLTFIGFRS